MDFAELLALLQNPGEEGVPDTIYDDITASYDGTVSALRDAGDGAAAQVVELEEKCLALEAEISRLNSMLFDQTMNSEGENPDDTEDDTVDNTEDEDDTEPFGVDALFGKVGK